MRKSLSKTPVICLVVMSAAHSAAVWQSTVGAQTNHVFVEWSDGFQAQISAIVEAYRAGDKATGRRLIEQFRLPHSEQWFAEHLGADRSATLTERYDKLFPVFAADLETSILDAVENQLNLVTEFKEGGEEAPSKLLPSMTLSGIKTRKETALFYSRFDRQRNGNSTGSWARAFTYEEGAFRFIGYGSKPFWIWEKDSAVGASAPKRPIQLAKVIHMVPAAYPNSARARGIEGKVGLKLLIDVEGRVKEVEVLQGDPALTQAAIDAVRQWRFKPPIQNGSPVESDYIAEIEFRLH